MNYSTAQLELIAVACHQANRAYCKLSGDQSFSWTDAPQSQRDSAVEGVKKALGGATPRQLHESWMDFKRQDGWVYGPNKDHIMKTHPCFLPYDELPAVQKEKDDIFLETVNQMALTLGLTSGSITAHGCSGA